MAEIKYITLLRNLPCGLKRVIISLEGTTLAELEQPGLSVLQLIE